MPETRSGDYESLEEIARGCIGVIYKVPHGTERELGAGFEREGGATGGGWVTTG